MPELTVAAPEGAHFDWEEVSTERGTKSLGQWPLLVWDDVEAARAQYGDQGITDILDGTSLRVSFQNIARRGAIGGKTPDDVARAQVEFRPGKRAGGASTPVSRARRAAESAAEKVDGDALATLLQKIAAGEIDVNSLVGSGS